MSTIQVTMTLNSLVWKFDLLRPELLLPFEQKAITKKAKDKFGDLASTLFIPLILGLRTC